MTKQEGVHPEPVCDAAPGYMLAILFEEDEETGARSVRDIIRVEGVDKNARRRLRRAIVGKHGLIDRYGYNAVTYETRWPNGSVWTQAVTSRFLAKATQVMDRDTGGGGE